MKFGATGVAESSAEAAKRESDGVTATAQRRTSMLPWMAPVALVAAIQLVIAWRIPNSFGLTAFGDIAQCVLVGIATVGMLLNVGRNRGPARAFWLLMGLGCGLWFVTQTAWSYVEVYLRNAVPNPFGGDVVLFIHIAPMIAAIAMMPHVKESGRRFSMIDFCVLLIFWLYLYLIFVIPWQYIQLDTTWYGNNFNLLYLVEDALFLVGLAMVIRGSSGEWRRIYVFFFGAALVYTVGSQFASVAIDAGQYYTGGYYDVPLMGGMAWFAMSGFFALSLPPSSTVSETAQQGVLFWPARVAMLLVLSTPLMALWIAFGKRLPPQVTSFRLLVTLVAILVLASLVFLKQFLLDRQLFSLLQASRDSVENLKRLQFQLVQSEKLASLGELVAGAAHEINNPLTAILGYADMLTGSEQNEHSRGLAKKITEQARRTKALVSDLLTFAQEHPTEKNLIRLDSILNSAVKLRQAELHAKGVRIELNNAAELPLISGDPNQMLKVFLHLIGNGIDALQEVGGGLLLVSTKMENGAVVIEFRDNGPGIRQPERIFDPFYTTKEVGKGTGLGLSVCYGIIQAHRGKIDCHNNIDKGATFRITLPVI